MLTEREKNLLETLKNYGDIMDFDPFLQNEKFSLEFIQSCISIISSTQKNFWKNLIRFQNLPEDFIVKHLDVIKLDDVAMYVTNLSDKFLLDHLEELNWKLLSQCQNFSEETMIRFQLLINWKIASRYQKLTDKLIELNIDKLNWSDICKYQILDTSQLKKYYERLDWNIIFRYQKLDEEALRYYLDKKTINSTCSVKFLLDQEYQDQEYYKDTKFINPIILDRFNNCYALKTIIKTQDLPIQLIIENLSLINWSDLFKFQLIPEKEISDILNRIFFLIKNNKAKDINFDEGITIISSRKIKDYRDYLIGLVLRYQNVSNQFLENNIQFLSKTTLSSLPRLTEDFIERHLELLDLDTVLSRPQIIYSEDFLENLFPKIKLSSWKKILDRQPISESFITKHLKLFKLKSINIYRIKKLSISFIKDNIDTLNFNWLKISKEEDLSEEFIHEFKDKIKFNLLMLNLNILLKTKCNLWKEQKN